MKAVRATLCTYSLERLRVYMADAGVYRKSVIIRDKIVQIGNIKRKERGAFVKAGERS